MVCVCDVTIKIKIVLAIYIIFYTILYIIYTHILYFIIIFFMEYYGIGSYDGMMIEEE